MSGRVSTSGKPHVDGYAEKARRSSSEPPRDRTTMQHASGCGAWPWSVTRLRMEACQLFHPLPYARLCVSLEKGRTHYREGRSPRPPAKRDGTLPGRMTILGCPHHNPAAK
jgi:hypothetical protein